MIPNNIYSNRFMVIANPSNHIFIGRINQYEYNLFDSAYSLSNSALFREHLKQVAKA